MKAEKKRMLSLDEIVLKFRDEMKDVPPSKEKVIKTIEFLTTYFDSLGNKSVPLLEECLQDCIHMKYLAGEVLCRLNFLFFSTPSQNITTANEHWQKGYAMLEKIKTEPYEYFFSLNLISYYHWYRGEFEKGFDIAFETLKYSHEIENTTALGWIYYSLGIFYFDTKDFTNSEKYYTTARNTFAKCGECYGVARSDTGIASVKIKQNKFNEAIPLLENAILAYREGSFYSGLARALNDLALIEKANGNFEKTIELFTESLDIRKEINHIQGMITTYTELGEIYLQQNDTVNALDFLLKGLDYSKGANARYKSIRLHKLLSDCYKKQNDIHKAFEHFEDFHNLSSTVLGEESANNIRQLQTKFATEKSDKEAEIERLKNVELKDAFREIEEKNKEITDSINYARRIQLGILPSDEDLNNCFENYFVLYKPKDIVSGDFYWAINATSQKTGDNVVIVAAVDCTGHGVPGAFMSMLGTTLLNQTIFNPEVIYPSDVLNFLNKELPQNLKSPVNDVSIRDGMDMALCSFDFKKMKMYFAGANNPCWIIRNNELFELKPDKQAISASLDMEKKDFTNQEFQLQKNDRVYLFTDGYADQFGGPKGKKFKYKQLKEILLETANLSMSEQRNILDNKLSAWRRWPGPDGKERELEQVDDVLIIGIKI